MKIMALLKIAALVCGAALCWSFSSAAAQSAGYPAPEDPGAMMRPLSSAPPIERQVQASPNVDAVNEGYILGTGDRIRLIVYGEPNLSGEFLVDSTGRVALPLIGEVKADGLSVREFESSVEQQLRLGYLNDPRVSAEVVNFRPFYILGEVAHPGTYPYTTGLTVFNAVATAGGFTYRANQHRVKIKHQGMDKELDVKLTPNLTIEPGDTIRIQERWF